MVREIDPFRYVHLFNWIRVTILLLHFVVDRPFLQTLNVSTGLKGITIHYEYEVTSNSPNVHHVAWKKGKMVLCIDNLKYTGGGIHDRYMTITSPSTDDAGPYTCVVANAVGAVLESLSLGNVQCLY